MGRCRSAPWLTAACLALLTGAPAAAEDTWGVYTEIASQAGISFQHVTGASGEKYYVETMGSGACWLDHDGDGDLDLYVVNSAALPGYTAKVSPKNRLFRNEGSGRFSDVTDQAGVGHRGYGMGCTAGDIDNDGDLDLYVTNFGPNAMYRNEGNGKFVDVTAEAGVNEPRWSGSAAFGDIDNDGDLDLYVTNYLDFTLDNNKYCGQKKPGYRAYCHPAEYNGVSDTLYRNKGNGLFEDVSESAGIANPLGKGLGVVFTDVNDDGWPDIYVANDKTVNFLYMNRGDGTFQDISITSGAGFSESGEVQAGMGTDSADINGDGRMDLIVTNLDFETNEMYLNNGDSTFTDVTFRAGLGQPNFLHVGFGADFLDYDNDGDKDLLIVNGHILDNIELFKDQVTYTQPRSMLQNDGNGRFKEVASSLGPDFVRPGVGRGLAVADMDNDGDLDFFVVNSNRDAQLFRNDPARTDRHWLLIRLEGVKSNRNGIGARVRLMTVDEDGSERWQMDEVKTGSSYCSQHDTRLHFGLGTHSRVRILEVRWPSGVTQTLTDVPADQILTVRETTGS